MNDKVSNKQLQLSDKFFLFDQRVVDKMNLRLFQSLSKLESLMIKLFK